MHDDYFFSKDKKFYTTVRDDLMPYIELDELEKLTACFNAEYVVSLQSGQEMKLYFDSTKKEQLLGKDEQREAFYCHEFYDDMFDDEMMFGDTSKNNISVNDSAESRIDSKKI